MERDNQKRIKAMLPQRKRTAATHVNTNILRFLRDGHSSMKYVAIHWMFAQPEEIARFTSIKKNKNAQSCGTSIYAIADG